MSYDVGDLWTPELTVKNDSGALTDATVTVATTSPTGVAGAPTVTHVSTGIYTSQVLLDEPGAWLAVWTVTGAVTGVEGQTAFARTVTASVVSVQDVRDAAGNLDMTTMDEADVQAFIDRAIIAAERYIGPIIPREVTEPLQAGGLLRQYPVLSVTSVTDDSAVVDPSNYTLNSYENSVARTSGWFTGPTTVTYQAGRTVIGEHIRGAIINHALNAIRRQRSSGTATFGEAGFTTAPAGLDNIVMNDLELDDYFREGGIG